jgi:MFS transporter, FHS family, glucose/mannose:H+ symporter
MKLSNKIFVNISLFFSMTAFAIAYTVASPMLIEISQRLRVGIGEMGYSFSSYFVGFIAGSLISSFFVRKSNRRFYLIFFNSLISVSVFFLTFMFNFYLTLVLFLFIGISGGFIESQVSFLMIELNRKSEGLFMNLSQVFFGIGAFAGPFLFILTLKAGIDWKYAFAISAGICLINLLYLLFIDITAIERDAHNKSQAEIKKTAGKVNLRLTEDTSSGKVIFLLSMLVIFFYVSAESGISIWVPAFLRINKSFSEILSGEILSFFWLATVIGRVLIGFLSKKISILNILIFEGLASILFVILGIYLKNKGIVILSFVLSGLFLSGIWPLIVTYSGLKHPRSENFTVSFIVLAGGVGGLASPFLLGRIIGRANIFLAMNFVYIFLFFVFIFILAMFFIEKRNQRKEKEISLRQE